MTMLSISVTSQGHSQAFDLPSGPFEFGRAPPQGGVPRLVIDDGFVSRNQLRVEELPSGRIRVENLSTRTPVTLADRTEIAGTETRELPLPISIAVGNTVIAIRRKAAMTGPVPAFVAPSATPVEAEEAFAAESYLSIQPVRRQDLSRSDAAAPRLSDAPPAEMFAQWMETVLALQRSDAGPAEFYAQAAQDMINMIGLDIGLVLLYGDKGWQVTARAARDEADRPRPPTTSREFSTTILKHVLAEKKTFFQDLDLLDAQESLMSVDAVVVSPIFGLQEEVVGALYGLRHAGMTAGDKIRPIEAQMVQLLAAAVGANLARTLATHTRTQFEQFFSSELVRELARDPKMLEGRDREVTILISDLRGFSTLSEKLGPQDTCRLVRDVMERLSERILEHGGVIVSYLGDGILAMWNAPAHQEKHAELACRAALAMLAELPDLDASWQPIIGQPMSIGIGINTGPAQVGNTGSSRKFMYGPLGNTVNLASRVEGATKYFKVPILITGSTREQVGNAFATRRLCQVRVVGINHPVELFELHGETASPEWLAYQETYEKALTLYEAKRWLKTCQTLLPLLEQAQQAGEYDHATLNLMKWSWHCLESPPDPFDPVMELHTK
jgi:adenylate cyclase